MKSAILNQLSIVDALSPEYAKQSERLSTSFVAGKFHARSRECPHQHFRMPLYEFRCPNGHDFEKFYRSIGTASAEEKCPVCGEIAARLLSAAGLVFKGSGFYITDYGKDGKKAERDAVTAAASAAETKAEKSDASDKAAKAESSSTESKPTVSESAPSKAAEAPPAPTAPSTKAEPKPAAAAAPKPKKGDGA